ncbi:FYVE and coiled-coil domain-containing protein 1-like isoform X2 [Dendronephthya gigantea]|uniref:FYVE and coiled-coil domain-containing protein 1-like isoform X2 n=1 Tax=Dendronephthya gigantea TaxID=151771 RepID=UPI00106D565B|nr:FYVE and coiled-coil domain-containing protein 1-like isoform X2 [Dendronephthya gigantea]
MADIVYKELLGFVAQLKSKYFENKDPIDDNEIALQKLCVKLETALRNGMKDKYSFLGMRKDYWNFFSECLPKDEGVRYVNSLSQLHTVQGKGRALIRYCLVQKTLADTIQRTLMHRKKMEWYTQDALLLNSSLSAELVGKLYDLNELEFHLSCTGCNLDISWPSYGRNFVDGFEKRSRRNSAESIASTTDFTNERIDPLIALNAEISALKHMISRELEIEQCSTDDGFGECSMSSTDDAQPSINEITLDVSRLHQFVLKWKSLMNAKHYKAEHEIQRLMEENNRLSQESNTQLSQLAEKHQNLSNLASKEATLQITDLQNKLRSTEDAISDKQTKLNSLREELNQVLKQYKDSQQSVLALEQDLSDSKKSTKLLEDEICALKRGIEVHLTDKRTFQEEVNDLKSEVELGKETQSLLHRKLEESESMLNIKTLEKDKIQEAFENVNGLVFGSFEDFESYYKSQLLDKEKGLEDKDNENKTLQERLFQLTIENEKLKRELQEFISRKSQNELIEDKEQHLEIEISEAKLEVKLLLETIGSANMNLSKLLHNNTDEIMHNTEQEMHDMKSLEDNCKCLVNNLNELDNHIITAREALAKAVEEKEKLDTRCESLSVENERIIQLNEDMKKERATSLLDGQVQQKDKAELQDQVLILTQEKTKLLDTIHCLENEKSEIDSEIQNVNEKLQEECYLKLVLENEVSDINEQLNKEKTEQAVSLKEIDRLKVENEKFGAKCKELNDDLVKKKEERLELTTSSLYEKKNELATMEELLGESAKLKEEMDTKIASYKEQIVNLQCTMEQQISSLKFQLSSEALKYDEEIKTLSEEKQEAVALRETIQEHEETITDLENKLKERNESWQTEKKKLTSDIKLLKNEIKVLNGHIDADKQEIRSIENTLMLSKKKFEKEKSRKLEYKNTIKEIREQRSENEKILEEEKSELEEVVQQLKTKLVSLLSDKSELWKKSTQLEFDMKTRLSETWVEDKNVTNCPQCNTEFTLFVRKHHCRFCGNVFCHNCSDNFVKTIHSRKPYRACTSCYQKEKELKTDTSWLTSQNDSNLSIDSRGSDTEEDQQSTPSKSMKSEAIDRRYRPHSDVSSNQEIVHERRQSIDDSDDSDDTFQIIGQNDVSEDSLSWSLQNDSLSIKHSTKLIPGDGSQDWSEVTIPARKRYLMFVEVLAALRLLVEFNTSEQDVLFGAAFQETESFSASKTLVPLCQLNSHERGVKKQIEITCPGNVMLVFDNTHPKSLIQKLRFKIYIKKLAD